MPNKKETEAIIRTVHKATSAWAKKYFEEDDKQSAKAKKLSKMLDSFSFGKTDKSNLAKLISEVTGEVVKIEEEEDLEHKPIVALVLTKLNTTDAKHNYETEKVLLSLGDGTAVSTEGVVGGMIPRKRSIMRPATKEEIDGITSKQIEKFAEEAHLIFSDA